jgi:hypothetical protein
MKIKRVARKEKAQRSGDYIDNARFLVEITAYRNKYIAHKENPEENPNPRISEYLGWCFLKIAEGQSKRRNFYLYPYRDEMISDGYFDCVKYANVFNPEKTNNPFAYFSQVCFYAFIRKIGKEKRNYYTLCKAIERSEIFGNMSSLQNHETEDLNIIDEIGYSKDARHNMSKFVEDYESTKGKKDEKRLAAAAAGASSVSDSDDE